MTAKAIGSNQNHQGNQVQNQVMHLLSGAPSSPKVGQSYYNTGLLVEFVWNGTAWRPKDAAALTDGSIPNTALTTNPLLRANHTGTQLASTISNLQSTVLTYTLDTFAAPVATVQFGSQRLTALAAGTQATDAVNLQQMMQSIAAAIAGQTAIKNPARVYAAPNITLSGLQTIDGVSLAAGDRVLSGGQSTASQIGLYVAASGAWSLATDASSSSQWLEGTEILIAEGTTYGGSIFRQVTQSPTITTLTFTQTAKINTYTADGTTLSLSGTQFSARLGYGLTTATAGIAVDRTKVPSFYQTTVTHDGSTLNFTVTHGLANSNPVVCVRDSAGNRYEVSDQATSANAIVLGWDTPQSNGTIFSVSVTG